MATYQTGLAVSNQAFTPPGGGVVGVREAVYTLTAALAENDIIEMIPVAPGERVVDLILVSEDLDTHVSPTITFDVGDGDDVDRYIDGSTIGQTGGVARMGSGVASDAAAIAINKLYTAADTIDVKVSAAVATGATTGTIRLRAFIVRG
jgi:hypothetical protein